MAASRLIAVGEEEKQLDIEQQLVRDPQVCGTENKGSESHSSVIVLRHRDNAEQQGPGELPAAQGVEGEEIHIELPVDQGAAGEEIPAELPADQGAGGEEIPAKLSTDQGAGREGIPAETPGERGSRQHRENRAGIQGKVEYISKLQPAQLRQHLTGRRQSC